MKTTKRPIITSRKVERGMVKYTPEAILRGPHAKATRFMPNNWLGTTPGNLEAITLPKAHMLLAAPTKAFTETGLDDCYAKILKGYIQHLETTTTAAQIIIARLHADEPATQHHGTWEQANTLSKIIYWHQEGKRTLEKLKRIPYRHKDW